MSTLIPPAHFLFHISGEMGKEDRSMTTTTDQRCYYQALKAKLFNAEDMVVVKG